MQDDLKNKTINGMLWTSLGKFGTLGLVFLSNLVLARLLMPGDFGCIGMLQVFIAISSILATAGFGTALVQKKSPTHLDFTSVFYWNLVASVFLYAVLFLCAPVIAGFYEMPELCEVLRVQSLSLIIQAFSVIQNAHLQKQLRFKELSVRNIVATAVGTAVAIAMAFMGYGVWSLVANNLLSAFVGVLLLWKMSSWRPSWEFSWQSLKELFSFGGLMALSAFVETVYSNLQSLVVGKWFSASELGYFTQAKRLEGLPTDSLSQIVNQVSFPVFSKLQDDKEKLLLGLRKNIKAITYLNFPLMVLLIVIARPLIIFLYGAKWEVSIPYFQILCVSSMVYTLNTLNTNVIKSLGKGTVYFWVQFSKRAIGILLILLGVQFGMYGLLWSVTAFGYVCVLINIVVNKRLIGYGFSKQLKDVGVYYITSALLGVIVYFSCAFLEINQYIVMVIEVLLYCLLYWAVSAAFRFEGYLTYVSIIKERLRR